MRAAAIQLNSTADKARNLERRRAPGRERRRRRRRAGRPAGEVEPARLAPRSSRPAPRRSTRARRSSAARGWARELGVHLRRRQHRRARRRATRALQHLVPDRPDGEIVAVYRKIHMFDVDVGGVSYRESDAEQPGEEIVARRRSAALEVGLTRLLRPALPRALPDPRRARARACSRCPSAFTRDDRPRPLGGAAAGARDREPGVRDRRRTSSARRRRTTTPTGAR